MIRARALLACLLIATTGGAQQQVRVEGGAAQSRSGPEEVPAAVRNDPVMLAMLMEMQRTRQLRLLSDPPYFAEVTVEDSDVFNVSGVLGAAFAPSRSHIRPVRADVRVGTPQFDNTNSVFSDIAPGTRYNSDRLPIENNLLSLRHALWLTFDSAYKTAAEALGRKTAALRGISVTDPLPDFWAAPRVILIEDPRPVKVNEEMWRSRVRSLSGVFKSYPAATASSVDFDSSQGVVYYANSEGSIIRINDGIAMLRARASGQAKDGMRVYMGTSLTAASDAAFPPENRLRESVEELARNFKSMTEAPVGEPYTGPVLFEPQAAAQLFAEVFASQLVASRPPVSDPGRPAPGTSSELESRLGARVLPDDFDVVDDPTLKEWQGTTLAGHYLVDLEGVRPGRLTLVEKGTLKTLYTSRQPVRGVSGPNGHARLPARFGVNAARNGNLIVTAANARPLAELRAQLLKMAAQQNKPYALVVRRMDFPSAATIEDLRSLSQRAARGGGGRPTSLPLLVYKVFPDGREELVRGLRFRSLSTRAFRDILAASSEQSVLNYTDNGMPLALLGAGSFIIGCSVVSPGVLFEDLELEAIVEDFPNLPVVPPPSAASPAGP